MRKLLAVTDSAQITRVDEFTWDLGIELTLSTTKVSIKGGAKHKNPTHEELIEHVLRRVHKDLGDILSTLSPQPSE